MKQIATFSIQPSSITVKPWNYAPSVDLHMEV